MLCQLKIEYKVKGGELIISVNVDICIAFCSDEHFNILDWENKLGTPFCEFLTFSSSFAADGCDVARYCLMRS